MMLIKLCIKIIINVLVVAFKFLHIIKRTIIKNIISLDVRYVEKCVGASTVVVYTQGCDSRP